MEVVHWRGDRALYKNVKYILPTLHVYMPRRKSRVPLERVSLRLPSELIMRIDRLVERGLFKSRSQLVKQALREMLKEPRFQEVLNEKEDDFPTLKGR